MRNWFKIEIDSRRVFGLDLLRFVAIMIVVLNHSNRLLPEQLQGMFNVSAMEGVSLFFVLSGFLFGRTIFKIIEEKRLSISVFKNLLLHRLFRILPTYYLVLITLYFLYPIVSNPVPLKYLFLYGIFSQCIYTEHPRFFGEAWSLSVQQWFLGLMPLLVIVSSMFQKKFIKHAVMLLCLAAIILVILFRLYRFSIVPIYNEVEWGLIFRKQVITRLDGLFFGVIGAYMSFYYYKTWIKHNRQLLAAGLLIFLFTKVILINDITFNGIYNCVFSFSVNSIATLLLLPYLSEYKTTSSIIYKPVVYISLISYCMYLLNLSIMHFFLKGISIWDGLQDNVVAIFVSRYCFYWFSVIMLSAILHKYFEVPATKLQNRFKSQAAA